jgi:hypothetical protein
MAAKKVLECSREPVNFRNSIPAKSWPAIVVRYAQRLRRSRETVAAARSTRLRPNQFIHFIAAAATNQPRT